MMRSHSDGDSRPWSRTTLPGVRVWEWDRAADTIEASPDWRAMEASADGAAAVLQASLDRVHPDDRQRLRILRDELLRGEADDFACDYRVQEGDSWSRVEERTRTIRDDDGRVVGLLGCEIEIAEPWSEPPTHDPARGHFHEDDLPVALIRFEGQQCVYVSELWTELAGRSAESAMGEGWIEAIHPEDREFVRERRKGYRHGTPGEQRIIDGVEGRYRRPDGTVTWIVAKMRIEYGPDGELARQTVAIVDIDDRKQLEQLRERLLAMLEASTDYIAVAAPPPGEVLWRNRRFRELRADLPSRGDAGHVADDHPEWAMRILETEAIPAVLETGSWRGETALLDAEGNEIPVSQIVLAHRDPDGNVECFSTVMRDTSAERRAERALRESERMFSSLAAAAPVAIVRHDTIDNCVYVNERWSEFVERPKEAALGHGWQRFLHPGDFEPLRGTMTAFAMDETSVMMEPFEGRIVLPDNSTRWILGFLAKELDDAGRVTGYVGTFSDIDRAKRAEEDLNGLHAQLRQVLEFSAIGTWELSFVDQMYSADEQTARIFGVEPDYFPTTYDRAGEAGRHPDGRPDAAARRQRGDPADPGDPVAGPDADHRALRPCDAGRDRTLPRSGGRRPPEQAVPNGRTPRHDSRVAGPLPE